MVMRIGRRRSRPACTMAAMRSMPVERSSLMCATSTMPMFTTTPIKICTPMNAMSVTVVRVTNSSQITPTMAMKIEVMMDIGYTVLSNTAAITR